MPWVFLGEALLLSSCVDPERPEGAGRQGNQNFVFTLVERFINPCMDPRVDLWLVGYKCIHGVMS